MNTLYSLALANPYMVVLPLMALLALACIKLTVPPMRQRAEVAEIVQSRPSQPMETLVFHKAPDPGLLTRALRQYGTRERVVDMTTGQKNLALAATLGKERVVRYADGKPAAKLVGFDGRASKLKAVLADTRGRQFRRPVAALAS